ncbi:MAG TPA: anti-sigma factor [Solirubrobacteraceae bacterium]
MTDCAQRENVGSYVLHALPDDEYERFVSHLESCDDCQREVADLKMAADTLPLAADQLAPPPELKDRIMAVVHAEAELLGAAGARADQPETARPPERESWWKRRLVSLRPLPAIGMATAVLAIGVIAGVLLTGGRESTRTVDAKVTLASAPTARAAVKVSGDDARLTVTNFPAAGSDHVYQVWLVRGKNKPESAGLFRVPENGGATFDIPESVKGVDQVMVSREPGGGSDQPTTEPIAAAALA